MGVPARRANENGCFRARSRELLRCVDRITAAATDHITARAAQAQRSGAAACAPVGFVWSGCEIAILKTCALGVAGAALRDSDPLLLFGRRLRCRSFDDRPQRTSWLALEST